MKHHVPYLLALILLPAWSAAQVYRCQSDDVTIFSDQPCDAGAVPVEIKGNLSVIPQTADIAEITRRNREYVDARQAEIAERRAEAARQRAELTERERTRVASPPAHITPVLPYGYAGYGYPREPRYRGSRRDRRRGPPDRDGARGKERDEEPSFHGQHAFRLRGGDG